MKPFRTQGIVCLGCGLIFTYALGPAQSKDQAQSKGPAQTKTSPPKSSPKSTSPGKVSSKPVSGSALFAKECAPCHGDKGVGGGGYSKPLAGNKTPSELSKYISQNMPPGEKTPIAQATEIAKYMHQEFYSPLAQERIRPPRVALARLTVKQFRNALADLIGPEHAAINGEPGGVTGNYYQKRAWDDKNKLIQRLDPAIDFNFGNKAPSDKPFDLWNFSVVWTGSVIAPETGVYEFIVQSDQNARVHVNGEKPVVDNRVRSLNEREFRGSVYLLAGRSYPFYLEFSKQTTGVNDEEKKKKIPPSNAFVKLLWKRPKLAPELIPSVYLSPSWNAETYICETAFPADDRSIGYERGISMDKEWDGATTTAALDAAEHYSKKIWDYSGVKRDDPDRIIKVKAHLKRFVTKAFRQPLSPEQEQTYIEKQFAAANGNLEVAAQRVVLLTLKSPRFLYREIGNRTDAFQIAAELSFGIWDTIPDSELLRAASAGELGNSDGRIRQINRLVNDPRAYGKLRDFLMAWLKVDDSPDIVKNSKAFPKFTDEIVTDLRTSLDLYLRETAWGPQGSFQKLMTSQTQYFNGRLAEIYGGNLPADASFSKVPTPERVGVLTHPYLLSRFAYLEGSSPIHRGVLIARNMMGRMLAPPPVAVAPIAASTQPGLTTRERVTLQTKPAACASCHNLINPLGFTLEQYDAIGKVREQDNSKPIDASGQYVNSQGVATQFSNVKELANYIANSPESQSAFAEKLFQHLTKQPVRAYGKEALPELVLQFKRNNYNLQKLMVAIMTIATKNPNERTNP